MEHRSCDKIKVPLVLLLDAPHGSYSCWLVGQYTTITGYEKVRQGNIHFAGEHCSYNFQGYMEGGAREGKRAAEEILGDYHNGAR